MIYQLNQKGNKHTSGILITSFDLLLIFIEFNYVPQNYNIHN